MPLANLFADAVGKWKHQPSAGPSDNAAFPDVSAAPPDSRRLIRDRRYCRVLSSGGDIPFDDVSTQCAWKALEFEMALVPGGEVSLANDAFVDGGGFELSAATSELVSVDSLYIDRHCITNADYARFVQSDGYSNVQLWPEEILPNVLQFVDRSGHPGPRFWSDGNPPDQKLDHPVVGICWYEANAYATWAGKRLPTTEEWQRAGTWPKGNSGDATEQRYPWGNAFDPSKANVWAAGLRDTAPVKSIAAGNTPNGVGQLIGNVWEWVDAQFFPALADGLALFLDQTMAEIRGGAFDTYFHSQATCQFRTGQPLLYRGTNVGFRCCVAAASLPAHPDSANPSPAPSGTEQ